MKRLLKILIIALGSIGIGAPIFGNGYNFFSLLYFTNLSNLLVIIISAIFLYFDDEETEIKEFWHILRFMATNAIVLTFLVFNSLLLPKMISDGNTAYLFSINNILVHNLIPILMIVDYLLYGKKLPFKKMYLIFILPAIYFVVALLYNPVFGITFPGDSPTPYFFLDYKANGWLKLKGGFFNIGVFYWIIITLIIIFLIGLGFHGISNLVSKRQEEKKITKI